MSLKETITSLFEPKEIKEAREMKRIESARHLEALATGAFLRDQISSEDYQLLNKLTFPFTKLDLRQLAKDSKIKP